MTRSPPYRQFSLAVVFSMGLSMHLLVLPALAQENWPATNRLVAEAGDSPQDRNSNWNWYSNGFLVKPDQQGSRAGGFYDRQPRSAGQGQQPYYSPPPGRQPAYGQEPGPWRDRGGYGSQPSPNVRGFSEGGQGYGGLPEKSRPWGEVPDYDPPPRRYPNDYRERYEDPGHPYRPPSRSDGGYAGREERQDYAPGHRRDWRDYWSENYGGSAMEDRRSYGGYPPEERRSLPPGNYDEGYRPEWGREDPYDPWRDDRWRRSPPPYSNSNTYPW